MATHLYLEQYLDSLESLPAELRRNFTLMHDLVNVKNLQILFCNAIAAYLCLFAEIKWYFVQKIFNWDQSTVPTKHERTRIVCI